MVRFWLNGQENPEGGVAPPVRVHRERGDLGVSTEQAAWPSGWGRPGVMSRRGPGFRGCFCGQLPREHAASPPGEQSGAGGNVTDVRGLSGTRSSGTGPCEGVGRPRKVNLAWSPAHSAGGHCRAQEVGSARPRPSGRPQQLPRDHGRRKEVPGSGQAVSFISSRHAPGLTARRP